MLTLEKMQPIDSLVVARVVPIDIEGWKTESAIDDEAKPHFEAACQRKNGYKIFNGLLYLENRLFVPKSKRQTLIEENHCDRLAAHGGVRATLENMREYWWPKMSDAVKIFVASCDTCQKRKTERQLPAGVMQSFEANEPFQLVAFDCLGPLSGSVRGRKHIIVSIDCFSRFVDAKAVKDVQAATFVRYLTQFIGRFGAPEIILTDNAPTFRGPPVDATLTDYHIMHRRSTPHHHRGNAVVERVIQSLQEKMSLIMHDPVSSIDWEDALPAAVLSINQSVNSTTGFSPFELMFGRRHPTRSDVTNGSRSAQTSFATLRELRDRINFAEAIAVQSDHRANAAKRFNSRHRAISFEIGELVKAREMGRRAKLQNRYKGPYKIVKREKDIYTVESCDDCREKLQRHVADLASYVVRQSPPLSPNADDLPVEERDSSETDEILDV